MFPNANLSGIVFFYFFFSIASLFVGLVLEKVRRLLEKVSKYRSKFNIILSFSRVGWMFGAIIIC